MFYLILAMNGFTDLREGSVYDVFSSLLFITALLETGFHLKNPYFLGCLAVLTVILILDRSEQWLGRGDYPILLAVSLHVGPQLPLVLIVTSGTGLVYMMMKKERSIPLVPFLFIGTLLAEMPKW